MHKNTKEEVFKLNRLRGISGKLPIVIIIVAVVVALGGAGAFVFISKGKKAQADQPGEKPEKKVELHSWKMDEFTVNLADQGGNRYLQVNMTLEVEGGKAKGGGGHGGESTDPEDAKVRDAIITVLTKRYYTELLTEKGKAELKEELKISLNEVLEERKVHEIYFTSFAMQ